MSSENLFAQLSQLAESSALPKSACSRELLTLLRPLLDTGVLVDERSVAGRRLIVHDASTLKTFIANRFPNSPVSPDASSRVAALARFRDTKSLRSDLPEIISLRGWQNNVLKSRDEFVSLVGATEQFGLFSFLLDGHAQFSLHAPCALVENPALFVAFHPTTWNVPLVIYGHGRLSNRAVNWLTAQSDPAFRLLHLPDYDPVGLCEFERLRERLGDRVQLHLPNHLADLFKRFSNPDLLFRPAAQSLLARLRTSKTPEVARVVALIDKHNGGLEQEALLISSEARK